MIHTENELQQMQQAMLGEKPTNENPKDAQEELAETRDILSDLYFF